MNSKTNPVTRRTVLKSAGACLALPTLEIMANEAGSASGRKDPPRMVCFYIPGAISVPYWFPEDDGPKYTLSPTLKRIERHRDNFTFFRGLQHIQGQVTGHYHASNLLTAHNTNEVPGASINTISMDQIFAQHHGDTYLSSLVLSHTAGVTFNTLSRNALGIDIPSLSDPEVVLRKLFPPADPKHRQVMKKRLDKKQSLLDDLTPMFGSLQKELGIADRRRLDQYASSIREVEERIRLQRTIMDKPQVAPQGTNTSIEKVGTRNSWRSTIETLTDLIVLGFQTDTTRAATYSLGEELGPVYSENEEWASKYPKSNATNVHNLYHQSSMGSNWHNPDNDAIMALWQRDMLLVECLGRMMDKLKALPATDGSVLDHTQILFAGMQAFTHASTDCPVLVAGGRRLGWKHGQALTYWKHPRLGGEPGSSPKATLSDLYLTMMQQSGIPLESFKESKRPLSEALV